MKNKDLGYESIAGKLIDTLGATCFVLLLLWLIVALVMAIIKTALLPF